MKKPVVFYSTVCTILCVGLTLAVFFAYKVSAQQPAKLVKLSGMSSATERSSGKALDRFRAPAAENSRLRRELTWNFGGKVQSGWEIYEPLIAETIGAQSGADSPEFALAVSSWQSQAGLPATGTVDSDTLGAFIKAWQARRLIGGSYPSPDQLIQAPITDFFDPTRDIGLLSLERQTYAAYKTMLHAAANDLKGSVNFTKDGELAPGEKFLTIVSGYRSREYQESLRRKEPTAGRAALAKFSVHSTGRAIDMYVGGEPVTTKDANRMLQVQTPVYKWLVKNAAKFGFVPYFYEPWHWEYVGTLAASK